MSTASGIMHRPAPNNDRPAGRPPAPRLTGWGLATLFSGLLGLVAIVGEFPAPLEAALTGAMIFVGPGAALRTWVRMPRSMTAVVVPTLGPAVLVLVSTVMVDTQRWLPQVTNLALAVVLVFVGLGRWEIRAARPRDVLEGSSHRKPVRRSPFLVWASKFHPGGVCAVAAGVTFVAALPGLAHAPTAAFGLLASGQAGAAFLVSALLAVVAFLWSLRRGSLLTAAVSLVLVVLIFRLPTAMATSEPFYSWTYKHLGVVDYILQNGRTATDVDIYSGWPGFFAAMAWFVSVTGMPALTIAQWFIVGIDLMLIPALYAVCRAYRLSPTTALLGTFLGSVANWVGQDYFSPQALSYVLAITVVALMLRSRSQPWFGWLVVPYFAAIVVSHQLTPYWLIGVALALGVLGRMRPRYLGVILLVIAGGYLWLNRAALGNHQLISGFDIFNNASAQTLGTGSLAQTITSLSARAVSVALLAGAAFVTTRALFRFRGARRWRILGASAIAFASFALLFGQSYGGEAIFRVYLYAIPGCVLLVAPVLVRFLRPRPSRRGKSLRVPVLVYTSALLLTAASLQASYGAWFVNLVTHDSVEVAEQVDARAPLNSILLSPLSAGPGRMTARYAEMANSDPFYDASLSSWAGWIGRDFADDLWLPQLTSDIRSTGRPAYILVNEQMRTYAAYNGLFPPGALDNFVQKLRNSPDWKLVVDSDTAQLFVLEPHG